MKTKISIQEISELDLKPRAIVDRWRLMVSDEIQRTWADKSGWQKTSWTGSKIRESRYAFTHQNFEYVENLGCGSIYTSMRPTESELWSWYRDSKSAIFWRSELLAISQESRFEHLHRPRADWIMETISENSICTRNILDVSMNCRPMLDVLDQDLLGVKQIIAAGIVSDLEGVSQNNIVVKPLKAGSYVDVGSADIIIACDSLDKSYDFWGGITSFEKILSPGGLLFITIPVASGFEIQSLWDRSPSILPPDKLNIPSIKCLKDFFSDNCWEIVELSTPGIFDLDVIEKVVRSSAVEEWPRSLISIINATQNKNERAAFVEFLQSSRMSSIARIVVRKKNDISKRN
jgi:hypothetical protein